MGFIKVVKNKAYYKRYQVKYKRRRQCKTDYYARKRLIIQDKNKYKTPKYRFVVRFSNKDISCQIVSADLDHDVVLASAYAHELRRYGISFGLTNYAAAYCTGLLLARRVNTTFKLDYEGCDEVDGEESHVEQDGERAPFKALLDVGLVRTSTGCRVFGALKGACDGGLNIPHSGKRFPGKKGGEADPDIHLKYIMGGHVSEYMSKLQASKNEEAYAKQFSHYTDLKIGPDDLEDRYKAAHAAIREDPNKKRDPTELGRFKERKGAKPEKFEKKRFNRVKLSLSQRRNRIKQKLTHQGRKTLESFAAMTARKAAARADAIAKLAEEQKEEAL